MQSLIEDKKNFSAIYMSVYTEINPKCSGLSIYN